MFNFKRRLTYANVAATVALVFSMSGGALAATHYLINSTSQINPKVLKALKSPSAPGVAGAAGSTGAAGPAGPAGPTGPGGKEGAAGKEGPAGAVGKEGPAGAAGKEGPAGATGKEGSAGKEGPVGPKGEKGEGGSVLAYAHVEVDGHVVTKESKGITTADITHEEETGYYCIALTGAVHNVQVTVDDAAGSEFATGAKALIGTGLGSPCKSTEITVETNDEGLEEEAGFYVAIN